MNFHRHKHLAKRNTGFLLCTYFLGISILVVGVLIACWVWRPDYFVQSQTGLSLSPVPSASISMWQAFAARYKVANILQVLLTGYGFFILVSCFKMILLKVSGGSGVLQKIGGVNAHHMTNPPRPVAILKNVVEEMAIASGMPVPEIYLLPQPHSMNALTVGFSPQTAAIGVTSGLIERLSRDELQAVMAHEFSHIVHGDMRLNLQMMGTLYSMTFFREVGNECIQLAKRGFPKKGGMILVAAGVIIIVSSSLAHILSEFIKAAISRQREFLADAAAVQFTRNPDALLNALHKIGQESTFIAHPRIHAINHMLFAEGEKSWINRRLATHPPLFQRMKRIDPDVFKKGHLLQQITPLEVFSKPTSSSESGSAADILHALTENQLSSEHMFHAKQALHHLPLHILNACRHPQQSCHLFLTLTMLRSSPEVLKLQARILTNYLPRNIANYILQWRHDLQELPVHFSFVLTELCAVAIRQTSVQEFEFHFKVAMRLIEADAKIDLFEYLLLQTAYHNRTGRLYVHQKKRSLSLEKATATMLHLFAAYSRSDNKWNETKSREENSGKNEEVTDLSLQAGYKALNLSAKRSHSLSKSLSFDYASIDAALRKLSLLSEGRKDHFQAALRAIITADGHVTDLEIELYRVCSGLLGRPLPLPVSKFENIVGEGRGERIRNDGNKDGVTTAAGSEQERAATKAQPA